MIESPAARRSRAPTSGGKPRSSAFAVLSSLVLLVASAGPGAAQVALEPVAPVSSVEDSVPPGVTPRGAFIRSMILPGWGHAAIDTPGRGGFYVGVDGGILLMILKTRARLGSARSLVSVREDLARARLERDDVTEPEALDAAIAADLGVIDAEALVASREGQQEDWVALGIFFVLLGGVDAYVSAHLNDFPEPLGIGPGVEGGIELSVSLPLGRR